MSTLLKKTIPQKTEQRYTHMLSGYCVAGNNLIPRLNSQIRMDDRFGTIAARLGFNRMQYRIDPGLYAIGNPNNESPVLVTANYKLTVDTVRQSVAALDAWILIVDTKGVNVWCAAGKGNFSTDVIAEAVKRSNLSSIVTHRSLILPQLGATGVSAHIVRKETGFTVIYGPVKINDIEQFLSNKMQKTEKMRTVYFPLKDRMTVAPIELIHAWKVLLPGLVLFFALAFFGHEPFMFALTDFFGLIGAVLVRNLLFPLLLPWIPGKPFALKGAQIGIVWSIVYAYLFAWSPTDALAQSFILTAVAAFGALNFTGSTTFTSLSGVQKEMKIALPAIIISELIGIVLLAIAYL